jgi:hypothetical protein
LIIFSDLFERLADVRGDDQQNRRAADASRRQGQSVGAAEPASSDWIVG